MKEVGFVRKSIRKMVAIRVIMALGSVLLLGFILTFNMARIQRMETDNAETDVVLNRAWAAEVAHYKWASNLSNALYAGEEFTGSMDPTSCVLGQWIYGEAVTDDANILSLREQLEPLHRELHESASHVLELMQISPEDAEEYYEQTIQTNLTTLVGLLEQVVERGTLLNDDSTQRVERLNRETQILTVIFSLFALGCLISLVMYVVKQVVKPILVLTDKSAPLLEGRLDLDLDQNVDNELGDLAKTLDNSMELIHGYVKDINRIMAEFSNGNFDVYVTNPFVGDFQSIEQSIDSFTSKMSMAFARINQVQQQVSRDAGQLSDGSQALAQGATEQSSAVDDLVSTLDKLSKHASENAKVAASARENARLTEEQVTIGSGQMEQMVSAMRDIISESQKIENIISTIEHIAFQTNILALNASVEAAHAGSAGKGFAVISSEVQSLAAQSDEATKATRELIENSVQAAQRGGEIVGEVSKSLQKTMELVLQSGSGIGEIAEAVQSEAEAISQVADGIGQISAVVQSNSASSQESAAVSTELFDQVRLLQEEIQRFQLKASQ